MWQHCHAVNVTLVPSSSLWHDSVPGSVEGATCHIYFPPLSSLRPKVSRSSYSLGGEQRGGWTICCPFSSLSLCFILSLLLCAQSAILSVRRSACCAYLSNTTQQWQWHCFLWERLTVYVTAQWTNGPTGRTFTRPHLQAHLHVRTCMSNDVACLGDL